MTKRISSESLISTYNCGFRRRSSKLRLANGKSIHALSALLLQLVQASAYGAMAKIRKLHSSAADMEVLDRPAEEKKDMEEEEARICAETVESAVRSATIIASYVLSKATTTKATKTSLDADYKTILGLFMDDLLTVLYRPEWPAASLYLSVFSRIMVSFLDDSKTGTEATASKTVALDYLADIAAKLKSLGMEMTGATRVAALDEVSRYMFYSKCFVLTACVGDLRSQY